MTPSPVTNGHFLVFRSLCACGARLGQHRVGDDACPNPRWRCGNGQPQWLPSAFVLPQLVTQGRAA